jgi:hypothetical protein
MKRFAILLAATAFVAACSGTDAEPAPEPSETAEAEVVVGGLAVDGKPNVGSYEITSVADGTVITQTVNADGTLTQQQGDQTATGTWTSNGPGNWCITAEGEAQPKCYEETIVGEVYTSTNVDDPADSWTVKRLS